MPNKTVYLNEYRPFPFCVESVHLNVDLYDDHALVTSTLNIQRQGPGDLHLFGDGLELVSLHRNGEELNRDEYQLVDGDLFLKNGSNDFVLKIVTRIKPQENTQLSGLYRSNHLFCTQCEAEGFRRITFFPDRPDVLSLFTTRITADKKKYPILLSNGNLVGSGDAQDGRHWALWEDPFKKPSYLFALVAGTLACVGDTFVTASGRKVDLRIYVEPTNEDKCGHAMESLKKAMRWDEQVYGREYDLDVFMIVAVSDFNMGAMENKGLNIFNSKYILARPQTATDADFAAIERVVAHEYFHNWTGNRVTCRDWFQLSLKEGLTVFREQEFSSDMNSRDVNRIMDVKALRDHQFPEDSGSMAHPVRPESYEEIDNFYTATIYEKGAEVIRMQHTLLGEQGFRKGTDLYFERHDGQAVTIDDFVAALQDANHVDWEQFKRWYSQAGTPEVLVKTEYKDGTYNIHCTQTCPPTPADQQEKKPFHIPIKFAFFDAQGALIPVGSEVLELRQDQQSFSFSGFTQKPVLSLLRGFSAPIRLKEERSDEELLFLLRYESDGFAKREAAQGLILGCMGQWFQASKNQWTIPEKLIDSLKHVLMDESLDKALRAEILSPPGFEEVAATLKQIDVDAIEAVRDEFRRQLGLGLLHELESTYKKLMQEEDARMSGSAYARRKLRNLCLWFLMAAKESEFTFLCQEQFAKAETMTSQISSFALLVNSKDAKVRKAAVDSFYQQWCNDTLVLDKWFSVQAICELPNTLNEVKVLMQHPDFNIKNPNKVRALAGSFCMANPRHFHALDGSGYAFLSDVLRQLDPINPKIAARLAGPFTRWQRFDKPRQELMKQQLEELARQELSQDLREVVNKSLAGQTKE
jgi:aminopeptidase N